MSETAFTENLSKILVLERDPMVRTVLEQQLRPEGFELTLVEGPNKALDELSEGGYSIVLAAQELEPTTGLEFFSKLKETHPGIVRLLLTSSLTMKELYEAVQSNLIHRFITKPWLREELLVVLRNSAACVLSAAPLPAKGTSTAELGESVGSPTAAATASSSGSMFDSEENGDVAVEIFIKMLGAFHPNLGNTADRTRVLCRTIAEILDLPSDEARALIWAGALHDIALVSAERGVVRRWLRGPEKCTDEELGIIKRHPRESEEMLKAMPVFQKAAEIVRCHHENWDGTGYPDRLKGEMIPWLSRLLAPAIYFCGKFQGAVQALKDMEAQAEKMFDPRALEIIAKAVPRTELPQGMREILLIELQPGMILAKDIYNTSGMCILAKGRELTTAWVNKINSINNTTPLDPLVLVYC